MFYGHGLTKLLLNAVNRQNGATVFGYYVNDPESVLGSLSLVSPERLCLLKRNQRNLSLIMQ